MYRWGVVSKELTPPVEALKQALTADAHRPCPACATMTYFAQPRQRVRLKLATFMFQMHGFVEGEVLRVSADAAEQGGDAQAAAALPLA